MKEFTKQCAVLSSDFVDRFPHPSGILSFVQYTLKLSRKRTESFIAILSAGYGNNICMIDPKAVLKYLEKAFSDDINITLLYPRIVFEEVKPSMKKTDDEYDAPSGTLKIDTKQVKIHPLRARKKEIFAFAGTAEPVDPQKEAKELYERSRGKIKSIHELEAHDETKILDEAKITIQTEDFSIRVPVNFFTKRVIPVRTAEGSGFIVRGDEIKFLLNDVDLFGEGQIQFKALKSIDDDKEQ